ncbi:hypothetical protein EVC30_082 [Rhizobium phage RHph_Y1_11]|nr:hypothetical protein EVC30_082 [Rhizobium phage RHph_Y1_11]
MGVTMRGLIKRYLARHHATTVTSKLEEAAKPVVIRRLANSLLWAYRNGYRPVPGYTVCERREDGTIYVAIEMTKEPGR